MIGRPSLAPACSSSPRVASRESIPGQIRNIFVSRPTPSRSAGTAAHTESKASLWSARMSHKSSPSAGTTLNASPERTTVGTTLSRSGPSGSW